MDLSYGPKMMLRVVLLLQCLLVVHGSYQETQPIGARYFDHIIQHAVEQAREASLPSAMLSIKTQLQDIYAACVDNSKVILHGTLATNTIHPRLCGTVGYINPLPTARQWTIYRLSNSFGIKLSIVRLNLPYMGLHCEFANLTISTLRDSILCGLKSGLSVYTSSNKMVVRLQQGYRLGEGSGFVAVYSAMEYRQIPLQLYSRVVKVLPGFPINYNFPIFETSLKSKGRLGYHSWHIVAAHYQHIHFPGLAFTQGVEIFDGPWKQSPSLQGNFTSGHCAYIVQTGELGILDYTATPHTSYVNATYIQARSTTSRNVVRAYAVPPGSQSLVVHLLDVQYADLLGHMVERCQYGGIYVYSSNPAARRYTKTLEFCQTRSRAPFTIQLTDSYTPEQFAEKFYVYVILYSAYSHGEVHATIKPRQCSVMKTQMRFLCNFAYFTLWPDVGRIYNIYGNRGNIGPITVKMQVVDQMYESELLGLSLQIIDQNVLTQEKYFHAVNVSTTYENSFLNPQMLKLLYVPGKTFNNLHLVILELDIRTFTYGFKPDVVYNTTQVAFMILPHAFSYFMKVDKSLDYLLQCIVVTPMYTQMKVFYDSEPCRLFCRSVTVTIIEYSRLRETYVLSEGTGMPLYVTNTLSQGSFELHVTITNASCSRCVISIQTEQLNLPEAYWNDDKNVSHLQIVDPGRPISWDEANEDCISKGKVLLEPSLDDHNLYFKRELMHVQTTGWRRRSFWFIVLPKPCKAFTDYMTVNGIFHKTKKSQRPFFVTSLENPDGGDVITSLPYVISGGSSDRKSQGRNYVTSASDRKCFAFAIAHGLDYGMWIQVQCNAAMPAVYICKESLASSMTPSELFLQNVSTAYSREIDDENRSSLEAPGIACPSPWLPGENVCVRLLRVSVRGREPSENWLNEECETINATVFHMPTQHYKTDLVYHQGIHPAGDVLFSISTALRQTEKAPRWMGMLNGQSLKCIYLRYDDMIYFEEDCTHTSAWSEYPENFYVACVKRFEVVARSFPTAMYECKRGSLIAEVFYCDGNKECPLGDDEAMCDAVQKPPTDCSPLTLTAHKTSTCATWCPRFYVPYSDGECIPLDALCNAFVDCADGWDEEICDQSSYKVRVNTGLVSSEMTLSTPNTDLNLFGNEASEPAQKFHQDSEEHNVGLVSSGMATPNTKLFDKNGSMKLTQQLPQDDNSELGSSGMSPPSTNHDLLGKDGEPTQPKPIPNNTIVGNDEVPVKLYQDSVKQNTDFPVISSPVSTPNPSPNLFCMNGDPMYAHQLCLYDLDPSGVTVMGCADMSHLLLCGYVGCPHAYKCRAHYCIPVRRVCDGVVDCPHGDDEVACEAHTCPGMLQCRGSRVCIPPWEVCDGRVHCLEFYEDEVYCDACPAGLECHGRAAKCTGLTLSLPSTLPLLLRALVCTDRSYTPYIIRTSIQSLSLIYLDVRNNTLTSVDIAAAFDSFPNLLYLEAGRNALDTFPSPTTLSVSCVPLRVVLLAHNKISELGGYGLQAFCNLQILVLHHNRISVLRRNSFLKVHSLRAVDLTHNDLMHVMDLPDSKELYWVESNKLLVCCLLPAVQKCLPVTNAFSSCTNLLHITLHRVLIYGQALATTVLNSLVIIWRRYLYEKEHNQIVHLTTGNLLMASYLILIAAVDTYYRDNFDVLAISWSHSIPCKLAACFNMLGAEVPLSFLVYIAIFRAYSISGFNKMMSKRSTWIVCLVIWGLWIPYMVGLVFVISVNDLALDSNICIFVYFASFSRNTVIYAHSVLFVVVNIILIALLFVFYGSIAWQVSSAGKTLVGKSRAKTRRRAVSLRLSVILVFTVLCWLPMLLSQLVSLLGVTLPESVSVWMAILILPINASFSPVLFGLIPIASKIRRK